MYVEDAITEGVDELDRVDELVDQVTRIEVKPERGMPPKCSQGALGCDDVIGNLGWVYLERELHALLLEDVEDR